MKETTPKFKPDSEVLKQQDDIALRASEMQEFQEIVRQFPDKFKALRGIRVKLQEHFPEIKGLPDPISGKITAGNEFLIAKKILELLT